MEIRVMLARQNRDVLLKDVLQIAADHPGNDVLMVGVRTAYGLRVLRAARTVDRWDPDLRRQLAELTGATVLELDDDDEDCDL